MAATRLRFPKAYFDQSTWPLKDLSTHFIVYPTAYYSDIATDLFIPPQFNFFTLGNGTYAHSPGKCSTRLLHAHTHTLDLTRSNSRVPPHMLFTTLTALYLLQTYLPRLDSISSPLNFLSSQFSAPQFTHNHRSFSLLTVPISSISFF